MMFLRKFKRSSARISLLLLFVYILSLCFAVTGFAFDDASPYASAYAECTSQDGFAPCHASGKINVSSRLYELLFQKKGDAERIHLIPGGEVFGIKIKEESLSVTSSKDGSPLNKGDKIIAINGKKPECADDVSHILSEFGGGVVKIDILRGGEKMSVSVIPKFEDGAYKLGITLRNTASGIGTVTFVDPETRLFGGLGHGVCDSDGSELIKIRSAEATGVVLGSVVRGEIGKPGELSGILNKKHLGCISENNECGVFGTLEIPSYCNSDPIPVARRSEVRTGEAEIISTLKSGKRATYKIEITEICDTQNATKSFKIKVTDPMLIALSGGIVRGMSGSPIIQNGMLVGAVTHVMVADPTEGYGIFIENMLASVPKALPNAA